MKPGVRTEPLKSRDFLALEQSNPTTLPLCMAASVLRTSPERAFISSNPSMRRSTSVSPRAAMMRSSRGSRDSSDSMAPESALRIFKWVSFFFCYSCYHKRPIHLYIRTLVPLAKNIK
jgi:hypothetical protein